MTASGALYWVKKFGYTYKKTLTYVEACPKKRETYLKEIQDTDKEELVYLDESGIDLTICKDRVNSILKCTL